MKNMVAAGVLALPVILLSCHHQQNNENNDVARQLFIKSVRLAEVYIDSLENSTDSTSLLRIAANYDIKITGVNFQFPPDTDLDLSEEENDSLIRMSERMGRVIAEKLKTFAGKQNMDSDSVPADSTLSKNKRLTNISRHPATDGNVSSGTKDSVRPMQGNTQSPPSHNGSN